ncbi:GNAT family N-acetyltransferase [Kitasatospora sp. NPDC101801]|uniref:GNAT family N-acetyltransferase n=1 Tax=Kitasatospora sp. NPDC101801 TaxID=3364103 RepID=UPI003814460C
MSLLSLHDKAVLAARFERDPALHQMELGDLDDLLWPHTSWYTAGDDGPVALLYSVGDPPTLLALGRPEEDAAWRELLHALLPVLPRRFLGHLSADALDLFSGSYAVRRHGTLRRMALTDPALADRHPAGPWKPRPLSRADLPELTALFAAGYPGNWFDDRMLDSGRYVGARDDSGSLVAVAGVHVHSPAHRVAALGNVTTHPAVRGRGAAAACVAELCRLLADTVDHVGLNVRADNATAVRLYERLGFTHILDFEEATFTAR